MQPDWLTEEHAALISAAATAAIFGGVAWAADRMSRSDEIRRRLADLGSRLDELHLPASGSGHVEPFRRYLLVMRERQDLLVELANCDVEEQRMQVEFNKRLYRWAGMAGAVLTGMVALAGGVIQLWEHLAN